MDVLPLLLAVAGFGVGLWQYHLAQRWKRSEFVASEIKDAFADRSVRVALLLLDWNERHYDLRERDDQDDLKDVVVADADFAAALAPHAVRRGGYTHVEERVRVVFDEFLGRLQRFEHFVETGLVKPGDLRPYLRYWMDLMAVPAPHKKSAATVDAIWTYIDYYGYSDLRTFFTRFGYDVTDRGRAQVAG